MTTIIDGNAHVSGTLSATAISGIARTSISTESAAHQIKLSDLRVWDAMATVLPGTSAADDLGLYGQTFGTNSPQVMSYDVKTVGATSLYARGIEQLPYNYVAGGSVSFKIWAGMEGAVADTSCTIDVEAYKADLSGGIGSDLVTTAATDINSLTQAFRSFVVDASGLTAGDLLDFRITIAVNDAAGGSSVQAAIGSVAIVCNVKG